MGKSFCFPLYLSVWWRFIHYDVWITVGLVVSAFQHLNNQSLGNETVWSEVSHLLKVRPLHTTCCSIKLRWQINPCILEDFCENLCLRDWILSPQQVAQNQIRLNLCKLLRQQNSVAETKIFTTIPHNTKNDLLLQCVVQLVAQPVHKEWFLAPMCCSNMSPSVSQP